MSWTHQSVVVGGVISDVQRQTEQVSGARRWPDGGALQTPLVKLHRQPVETLDLQGLQVRGMYRSNLNHGYHSSASLWVCAV